MLEEYRYCGKGESLEVQLFFFQLQYSQFLLDTGGEKYKICNKKCIHKQLSETSSILFSSDLNIFLLSFFLTSRREFLSCILTSYFSHQSILTVVNTGIDTLWQIIINENRRFCCTMTFCYKRHIFAGFCETVNYSNRTQEKVFKNQNCSYLHFYVVFYLWSFWSAVCFVIDGISLMCCFGRNNGFVTPD